MENKVDLRTLRTQKLLSQALLTLLQQKSYEEISITDICELAMIHRTTFYKHFNDKFDLFCFIFDEARKEIFSKISTISNKITPIEQYKLIAKNTLDFIDENKEQFFAILQKNNSNILIDIFNESLYQAIKTLLKPNENYFKLPIDVIASFYTGGFSSLAFYWLTNPHKTSKELLLKYINQIFDDDTYFKDKF